MIIKNKVASLITTVLILFIFNSVHIIPKYINLQNDFLFNFLQNFSFAWHYDSASKGILNIDMKVPILVEESHDIIFFPVTSCINKNSIWISYQNLIKYNKVYLWVYIDNIRAVKLYKRLGFKVKEETDKRYFMERG